VKLGLGLKRAIREWKERKELCLDVTGKSRLVSLMAYKRSCFVVELRDCKV